MYRGIAGLVLIGLLGMSTTGCSREAGIPIQTAASSEHSTTLPGFWRDSTTRVRFAAQGSNLTLIARYVAEGMKRRTGSDFAWSIYGGGDAFNDDVIALGEGETDFALTTPPVTAKMALEGKGYFKKAYPNLRGIAAIPQDDWLACAVSADLGVKTFEEVRARKVPLRIATAPMGANNGIGFLAEQLLRAYGITLQELEGWGGGVVAGTPTPQAVDKVLSGEANAICQEWWKPFYELTDKMAVEFLPVSDEVLNQLGQQFGYQRNVIPKGLFAPSVPDRDISVVDFSDWIVLANSNVPDEIAYLAAQVAVEDRAAFEAFYIGLPERQRWLDVPMKPEVMWENVGVPLHPGAEKYYREAGLLR